MMYESWFAESVPTLKELERPLHCHLEDDSPWLAGMR